MESGCADCPQRQSKDQRPPEGLQCVCVGGGLRNLLLKLSEYGASENYLVGMTSSDLHVAGGVW